MTAAYHLILWLALTFGRPEGTAQAPAGVCPPIIKAAHRYHGILVSYEDASGDFFIRNGRRCRLFTQGFLESIK